MSLAASVEKIRQRQRDGLYRKRLELTRRVNQTEYQHQTILNFSSNDYLGLSQHPQVIQACQQAAAEYGVGSGASMMVSGYHSQHKKLENALAEFLNVERVLLFPSGYMANLGAIGALSDIYPQWFFDKHNHASLYDAARLNAIQYQRYQHGSYSHLAECIAKAKKEHQCIVTEGVFSMDGQQLNVDQLSALAIQHQADILIDDSHALGVIGEQGRGSLASISANFNRHVIITSSFGKAFGCGGGFVAGDAAMIEHIEQYARSFIYTTALSPAIAAAVLAAMRLIQAEQLQKILHEVIGYFKQAAQQNDLPLLASNTAIQPILLQSACYGEVCHQALLQRGILVGLMRPPSVPQNKTCLRITLTAKHTKQDIDQLILALHEIKNR